MRRNNRLLTAVLTAGACLLCACGSTAASPSAASSETAAAAVSAAAQATTAAVASTAAAAETAASADTAATAAAAVSTSAQAADATASAASDGTVVHAAALKGPTAMGLVKFMDDADSGALKDLSVQFTISAAPDEVTPGLVQGATDIAAVPGNLASVLYNKTKGGIEVLAINTLGVLYIVDTDGSISGVQDLRGRTVYASGKGSTPEYVLNYILTQNGLTPGKDVTVEWKSEHSECLSALLADKNAVAMLPEPFVTTAQLKNSSVQTALDLTAEWDSLQKDSKEPSALVMGVLCARKEFVQAHPAEVASFMAYSRDSAQYVNENTADAAKRIGARDIVPEAVAAKALPKCSVTYIDGTEMKEKLSGFLQVLYEQDPKATGGALPGDDFYYGAD
ncbi:MAG: ABC transporter substrate-binding protein [Lachnospiraceae bacterium]|jgi:NitT/TauT family transport system substrate-binding protein|nr:ABC transporter substrate-binding protein [Lachnospiraceae bacterium]